jgi:hypothetical protein
MFNALDKIVNSVRNSVYSINVNDKDFVAFSWVEAAFTYSSLG